jgi:hypothetical protein
LFIESKTITKFINSFVYLTKKRIKMKKTNNKQLLFVIPAMMAFAVGQAQSNPAAKEPGINVNYTK